MIDPSQQSPEPEPHPVIDLTGIQAGDIQFQGDVAGRDVNKPIIVINPPKLTLEERLAQRNRAALIQLVEQTWLDGVLRASLHHQVRLELDLAARPDTVNQPWRTVVRLPNQEAQSLPPGTGIADVFAQAAGRLLILGAPGSGKTTTLLMLAEQLLDLARVEETAPVPVVFVLSTWSQSRPPLNQWLVDELRQRYKVDPKLGKIWVEQKLILPLLDGLDEVGPGDADRAACIAVINDFLAPTGASAVICSRSAEYERQNSRLQLDAAVEIQPLTPAQVDSYLTQLGPPLASLRLAVERDATLRELAMSPLLLDVMALTYRDVPSEAVMGQEHAKAERRLWQQYIDNRFAQVRGDVKTEAKQMRAWLTWLARGMVAHQQQVFYIEYLQPSWLATRWQKRIYNLLSSLSVLLAFCLSGGLFGLLDSLLGRFNASLVLGGLTGSIVGLILGAAALVMFAERGIRLQETLVWPWQRLFFRQAPQQVLQENWGPIFGISLLGGTISGLLFGLLGSFVGGLTGGFVGGLVGGVVGDELHSSSQPNEGIRRTFATATRGGLSIGLGVALGSSLGLFISGKEQTTSSISSSFIFLLVFMFSFAFYGGIAVLKHYLLRRLLHRCCGAPWAFASALNEAVSRNLMTRVGGGFRFYHRLLQEHFAEHEQPELPMAPILGPQKGDSVGGRRAHQK